MVSRSAACDPGRLEVVLAGSPSERERRWVEEHLESCVSCRQWLHEAAADSSSWEEASRHLRDEPFDMHPLSRDGGHDSDCSSADAAALQAMDETQRVLELLAPTDDPRMLGRLAGYEIMGVIGAGGMGVVLKALDTSLNRYVAIKVLTPRLASSGAARRRFAREAQAAAAVVHQHVIAIHAVSPEGELPLLVMPYIRGGSLQKRLDEQGPLQTAEILRIGAQVAAGLAAAHSQGLVHRDIKPANILLEDGVERVTITDFGLARAVDDASTTRTGIIAGTPQYMSPEQARGGPIDHRSDLFSLGSVLYAMCTGRSPFRAETTFGVLRRITDDKPRRIREVNPEIPPWLEMLVERTLAKDAQDRFQSAHELSQLLEACLAHWQQPSRFPLPAPLRRPRLGRLGLQSLAVATVCAAVVLLAFIGALNRGQDPPQRTGAVPSTTAGASASAVPPVSPGATRSPDVPANDRWGDDEAIFLLALDDDIGRLEEETRPPADLPPPFDSEQHSDEGETRDE